jgi:hypothetical protein
MYEIDTLLESQHQFPSLLSIRDVCAFFHLSKKKEGMIRSVMSLEIRESIEMVGTRYIGLH